MLDNTFEKRLIPLTRILKKPEVLKLVPISNGYLYELIRKGQFPKPISLGSRAVGWVDTEVQEWVENKITQRNETSIPS
jgi:prophage regulatory protein